MTQVSYIFGDLLTGAVIDDISLYGVSMSNSLDGGELRGSFQYDQTGKINETLEAATIPGRCYCIAERNGVPVWGGIVWTRTYQSQAKVEQLFCRTFDAYGDRRLLTVDFSASGVEQTQLFLDLYTLMQSDPNALQVELPASLATPITKSLEITAAEQRTYRSVFDSIADTEDGFDWVVDVYRQGSTYRKIMRMGHPTLGSPISTGSTVFDYPGVITNYWQNESMSEAGTHIYGIGAGEGESMLVSEVIHQSVLDGGFPRYDNDISMKDIADQATLDSVTLNKANILRPPMPIITAEIKGDSFGDYGIGDSCVLHIVDPKHPLGLNKETRIISWEYVPQSDSSEEMVRFNFEGDELA